MLKLMPNHRCLWSLTDCLYGYSTSFNVIIKETFSTLTRANFCDHFYSLCCNKINSHQKCYFAKKKQVWRKTRVNNDKCFVKNIMSDIERPEKKFASCGGEYRVSPIESEDECNSHLEGTFKRKKGCDGTVPKDFRKWEPVLDRPNSYSENGNLFRFKVLSYNVLAQYLLECHPYLYTESPTQSLKWAYRSPLLFDEITKLSPDILCLQEVQASHLPTFYSKFEELGYQGVFKQKTGYKQDGCAIYFKKSMFDMKDHISVEFYQPEIPILNRDNIGLMVKLTPKNMDSRAFVIATTHLLYNPKRTDVRLAQMRLFLAEIDRFCCRYSDKRAERLPLIMTGDFNSLPDSAVIQLLSNGSVSTEKLHESTDWRKIAVTDRCQHLSVFLNRKEGRFDNDLNDLKIKNTEFDSKPESRHPFNDEHSSMFNGGQLVQDLSLRSIYDFRKSNGELEATSFQDEWCTVDYIFYSDKCGLTPIERYRLPTDRECQVIGSLPNNYLGSDHLLLGATFSLDGARCNL